MSVENIKEKLWRVQHLQHRIINQAGYTDILHECGILTDEGHKVAAVNLDFLGLEVLQKAEAEWKLAEHLVEAHNFWLALKDNATPKLSQKEELTPLAEKVTNGNRGKWFTDGKQDVKAKECPPGFRPGRSNAFRRKDASHEEVPQTQASQSPQPQHQVQTESHNSENGVQAVPFPEVGEGWFRG